MANDHVMIAERIVRASILIASLAVLLSGCDSWRIPEATKSNGAVVGWNESSSSILDLQPFQKHASGTGVVIDEMGHVLTTQHVIASCHNIKVVEVQSGHEIPARVTATDTDTDLAIMLPLEFNSPIARFRRGRSIRSGDDVIVLGFPLSGILATEAHVTSGSVSALAGPGDDRRLIQITAPVQPGNSGSPILDQSGNIVGIVMGKLNDLKMTYETGVFPQNVNFAVSEASVRTFLDSIDIAYETAVSDSPLPVADVAELARNFIVRIDCWT